MDVAVMARRCPGARLLGSARLSGYRFVIARAGYAGLEPDAASDVHGVIWDLTAEHVAALDDYEGIEEGLYRKAVFSIEGGPTLIYVPADRARGKPEGTYLGGIVSAARYHGFPGQYVREIEQWL